MYLIYFLCYLLCDAIYCNLSIIINYCNPCIFSLYKLKTFHKNIHKQEKPFLCPKCKKGFKSIKQLRNHKVRVLKFITIYY